jgi:subtilisin family serine protease
MRSIETDPAVEFAEPNWIYRHTAESNDTYYTNGSLWGMYGDQSSPASAYGSQAAEAWSRGQTCASSVYVGVIDEGVMISHPDLAANIGTNPGEIAGDGIDNDGNGYVDDVNGWDFAGNDNTVYDGKQDDHGTHVSGTIGAVGGNGAGVAGVCWNVKILNAKFLGRNGGTTANAIKAIDYLTDLKTRHGLNLVATNNSWGGGGYSKALQDAIERANQMNILFIAAAGNSSVNNDTSPHYPSSYTNVNVIAVASITSTGALSSFSNYGATSVDLAAPGSGIWSTVPGRKSPSYASYSGTSMATPHVTGAAAMYASAHPGATAGQIKAAILGSVVPTPSLSGKTVTGGRLNVSGF